MKPVPDLEWQYPWCPECDATQTKHDGDSFYCPSCRCWWSNDGTGGQRPDAEGS